MAHRDDHVLALDQRLDIGLELDILDRGAPRVGELRLDRQQLAAQHLDQPRARAQDVEVAGDLADQLLHFVRDLLAFEAGQPLQPQIEDRARLLVGQLIEAVGAEPPALFAEQRQDRRDIGRRPAPPDEPGARALPGRARRGSAR